MLERFTPNWRNETAAKSAYIAYNEQVRATAPPDRLIEWQSGDGWEPICSTLGIRVPNHPFPHVNTTADTRAEIGLDRL
jgi:hypothetical protein